MQVFNARPKTDRKHVLSTARPDETKRDEKQELSYRKQIARQLGPSTRVVETGLYCDT